MSTRIRSIFAAVLALAVVVAVPVTMLSCQGCQTEPQTPEQQALAPLVKVVQANQIYQTTNSILEAAIRDRTISDPDTARSIVTGSDAALAALQQAKAEALRGNALGVDEYLRIFEASMRPLLVERLKVEKLVPVPADMSVAALIMAGLKLIALAMQLRRQGRENATREEVLTELNLEGDESVASNKSLHEAVDELLAERGQ